MSDAVTQPARAAAENRRMRNAVHSDSAAWEPVASPALTTDNLPPAPALDAGAEAALIAILVRPLAPGEGHVLGNDRANTPSKGWRIDEPSCTSTRRSP